MPTIRPTPPPAATTGARGGLDRPVVIRDTETETLLRTCTNPLFRAAGLDVALARSIQLRDAALNSFTNTGNPVFMVPISGRRPGDKTASEENRKGF